MQTPTPNQHNMDLSKMQALQQKRTLAFVNHFVMTNVQVLNNFMKKCDYKLMQFERKLEKINAAMVLLEARLSSIPEVNTPAPTTTENKTITNTNEPTDESKAPEPPAPDPDMTDSMAPPPEKISRPEYDRFIKMVHVGVPLQAVKLKASLEGLDPNILEELLNK